MKCRLQRTILLLLLTALITNAVLMGQDDSQKKWDDSLAKYPIPEDAIELKLQYSFPSEDLIDRDIYLWRPTSMDRDSAGNIYISDQKWCQVLKFDLQGNFIRKIGRKGEGPGEFANPYCLAVTDDFLIVSDTSGRKIQYFTYDGEYVRTIKVLKAYIEFIVDENGQMFAAPLRLGREPFLIELLDEEGNTVKSFGELRFGLGNIFNMFTMTFTTKGDIITVFQHFPTVCEYSKSGDLLSTFRIEKKFMKDREKKNLDSMRNKENVVYPVTAAITSGRDGFYILSTYPRVSIYEFDTNGNLKSEYFYAPSHEHQFKDFFVIEKDDGDRTFYVLQRSQECKVDVLGVK